MTIRTTALGGTDWSDGEVLYSADLNDTIASSVGVLPSVEQIYLNVTTSSSSASYSSAKFNHLIKNTGLNIAYINFDNAATTQSYPLLPNESIFVTGSASSIYAITSTSTTKLVIIGG